MVAPVAPSPPRSGHASLQVELVCGQSAVTAAFAASPVKVLSPRARGPGVWAYLSSYGGGLVAGDQTRLDLDLADGTRAFVGTQASTKIYRNPAALPCGHHTRARVGRNAVLVFAPDAVQAFAGSIYRQSQEFHLAEEASLLLVDAFTSGRAARGERWQFRSLASRNEVWRAGQRVLLDALRLDAEHGRLASPHHTGRFNAFATLFLTGPAVATAASQLLQETARSSIVPRADLIFSASPVGDGALLRVAGVEPEAVRLEVQRRLSPLADALDGEPWLRKW